MLKVVLMFDPKLKQPYKKNAGSWQNFGLWILY